MPGFEGVRGAAADIEARKNSGGGGDSRLWFKLRNSGDSAVVRFLEEGEPVDRQWAWFHELDPRGNQRWGDLVPCRDQDVKGKRTGEQCPGCDQGRPRSFSGFINLIWRDAPVFKRNAEGRYEKDDNGHLIQIGTADQVAVWQAGITVFEELDAKDIAYKGLTSRDFRITRVGQKLDTKYRIEPADPDAGPVAMSQADEELAKTKYDFTPDVTPPSVESYFSGGSSNGQQQESAAPPADVSPFMKS